MKTGTLRSMSFHLFVVSFVVLTLVEFSSTARRGCNAYGHSCFGGHGKRSISDVEKPSVPIDPQMLNDGSWCKCSGVIQEYNDLRIGDNRLARSTRSRPNYMSQLIGRMIRSNRHSYDTGYSETNDN